MNPQEHCDGFKGLGGIVTGIEPVPMPHFVLSYTNKKRKNSVAVKQFDLTQNEHMR